MSGLPEGYKSEVGCGRKLADMMRGTAERNRISIHDRLVSVT